jgi:hypothetical protein
MVTSPEIKLSITEAKALYGFLSESLEVKWEDLWKI